MQHKCKVTVIDKKLFPDLQEKYLADPRSGACPFYEIGQEFLFERYGGRDDFWREGNGTQCAEAWDCISRYIYTALQGGRNHARMDKRRTHHDRLLQRRHPPRRIPHRAHRLQSRVLRGRRIEKRAFAAALAEREEVKTPSFDERGFLEVVLERDLSDKEIEAAASSFGLTVERID